MATPPQENCIVCNKDTSKRCEGCSEGLDIDGIPAPTYYCSRGCQVSGWTKHKPECHSKGVRKQLFRGGKLLAEVFFKFREAAFDIKITAAKLNDGFLELYEPFTDTSDGPLYRFPHNLGIDEKYKNALLAYKSCGDSLWYMHELIKKAFDGVFLLNRRSYQCS